MSMYFMFEYLCMCIIAYSAKPDMNNNHIMSQPLFWSAHVLPLQVGCTDIAILDLPFGPAAKKTPPLYRSRVPKVGFM